MIKKSLRIVSKVVAVVCFGGALMNFSKLSSQPTLSMAGAIILSGGIGVFFWRLGTLRKVVHAEPAKPL